jgi:ParB/RepB/Spo0J family partition protein
MESSVKKHGILQSLLRPIPGPIPYKLVAGERRYISAERTGQPDVPAMIKEMTDEEEADIQLAENIHRKSLTQFEIAKKIQRDLDAADGDVAAVMAKHNKSRAWLSKMVGLLSLSEQAKRLLNENISADIEVINKVKVIERVNPNAAKLLVDDLKDSRGKEDARKKADAAKNAVKPAKPKAAPAGKQVPASPQDFADAKILPRPAAAWPFPVSSTGARCATPVVQKDGGDAAGNAVPEATRAAPPQETLDRAYSLIFENGASPKVFVDTLAACDRNAIETWLVEHYNSGCKADDAARAVMQGLRNGIFATDGAGAFAMTAFLRGSISAMRPLDLVRILSIAKP